VCVCCWFGGLSPTVEQQVDAPENVVLGRGGETKSEASWWPEDFGRGNETASLSRLGIVSWRAAVAGMIGATGSSAWRESRRVSLVVRFSATFVVRGETGSTSSISPSHGNRVAVSRSTDVKGDAPKTFGYGYSGLRTCFCVEESP
jgi:hypothetical protein